MMNLGVTTKNWGAPQDQNLPVDKGNKLSATDAKAFGDKPIGTVLNEIADPNYVDPTKIIARERKTDLDKDAFFKLMLTQMKNQDPMNPMQSHEMAAHLAQFTSLEQMFNVNANLEAIKNAQKPVSDYQALGFIGKEVSADSSTIFRQKDDASHELRFNLLADAMDTKIILKNEAGEQIREIKVPDLKKGQNMIRWDGYNEQGQKSGEGEFKFEVEALSTSGKKITVDTNSSGRITGIQFTKKGPMLLIGKQQVYLSDVKKIIEDQGTKPEMPQMSQPPQLRQTNQLAQLNQTPQMNPLVNQLQSQQPQPKVMAENKSDKKSTHDEVQMKPKMKKQAKANTKAVGEKF